MFLLLQRQLAKSARKKLRKKIKEKKSKYKNKITKFIKKTLHISEDSWIYRKCTACTTPGTFEHFVVTSFVGFLGGILLTYMFFFFFVFQLNFSLTSATILCAILGFILTLGLAYFMRVRCIVFLLLPQFCSKRGRHALVAYAFILTLTGPLKNTLHNIGVLSESLACGQDQLKQAVKTVMQLIKQPFFAIKDSIQKISNSVKMTVKRIKESLLAIKRLVLSILRVIKGIFEWLASIINICNKTLGTPYDRCIKVFDGAIMDCKAKLGPSFDEICSVIYAVRTVCYIVKPLDFICGLVSYIADSIIEAVEKQIRKFTTEMKAMFYVKVKFSHSFKYETNQSRTFEEVSAGIATEIRQKTEEFLALFDWMSFFTTFFVFFMLLRVLHYRHKWLTSDRFDNRYITREVRRIDYVRGKLDKETILPLSSRERNKYTTLGSIKLIKAERLKLAKSAVFLSLTTFKFIFHIVADYSLYWMLDMIRYHGRIELKVQKPNSVGIHVAGTGFLAELYKSIIKAFNPIDDETYVETVPCLPDPTPPDYDRYAHILILIFVCWLTTVIEPYGLRLRHVVMNSYHPDRARQRAVWLYNHIIRSRGSFLKFARRQLRRKFIIANGQAMEKVTLSDRMYAVCPILKLLFPREESFCLLCGSAEKIVPHIKCPTPNCVGLYCTQCFADMQNLCTICKSPLEYGDFSDLSEEKDSSEEDINLENIVVFAEEEQSLSDPIEVAKQEETDSDRESLSSYSYQYESPAGLVSIPERIYSTDIEAQKLRDDVTTQIFEYSGTESDESSWTLIRKVKDESDSSASSTDKLQLFAPDIVSGELTSEKEYDRNEETDLLLPKNHETWFKRFSNKISRILTLKKRVIKDDTKQEIQQLEKKKPIEEIKEFLEKTRTDSLDRFFDKDVAITTSDSGSDETVLFLNVPEGRMQLNCTDQDFVIINENFNWESDSEDMF